MTYGLANEIRRLKGRFWSPEDQEFLGVLLAAVSAAQADEQPNEETARCAKCKITWAVLKLDKDGICPNCLLDALYLRQKIWRKSQYLPE